MGVEIKIFQCLICGYEMNRTQGLDAVIPQEGDVSLCFGCGEVYIFTSDGGQREPTPKELIEIKANQKVAEAQARIRNRIY